MNNDKQYWSGLFHESCLPRQEAIEAAREWLADGALSRRAVLEEMRPPTLDDLPDYTDGVVDTISERLREDDCLAHDSGWPGLPSDPQPGPELDALRAAIRAYIAAHVDLRETWVPTGKYLIVHRDGSVEEHGADEDGGTP